MKYGLLTSLVLLFPLSVNAGIYKCVVDGKTTFSQSPCAPDAQEITIKKQPAPYKEAATQRTEKINAALDEVGRKNQITRLEKKESALQRKISRLDRERDAELKKLERKKRRAENNFAGATWEQSISEEMQAVSMTYADKIQVERDKLKFVRDEITALKREK
ncbi:MAG: DUF4124 domain-containing protein [Chromatiales bacterium]|nr:DUF4124 domain-containing protein [Chromatiales bacterium]